MMVVKCFYTLLLVFAIFLLIVTCIAIIALHDIDYVITTLFIMSLYIITLVLTLLLHIITVITKQLSPVMKVKM